MSEGPVGYDQAVRSWARHLRGGGRTPWLDWSAAPSCPTVDADAPLPGAAQLELVRRLALRTGSPAAAGFADLADVALGRSGPGRGLGQQPLVWGGPARPFGPPPVDPAAVPVEELVRVGVGALTELLLRATPVPPRRVPARTRRPWARGPAFALAGAPLTVSVVRRQLAAAGHLEGGRAPQVVLLAEPLDVALVQVWSSRVQAGAPVRWRGFVERCARGGGLPAEVDLAALARHWATRVGPHRVHVVARQQAEPVAGTVAAVLGLRLDARHPVVVPPATPPWAPLCPEAVDVVRRVNAVLGVRAAEDRSAEARRRLVTGLAERRASDALAVPRRFRGWARRRAGVLGEQLSAGDYAVHGSLAALAPRPGRRPAHPDVEDTLRVVLDACLQQADLPRATSSGAASSSYHPMRAKEH